MFQTAQNLLFAFRSVFSALLLILVRLLLPDFAIGAKYHILFESIVSSGFIHLIQISLYGRFGSRTKGFVGGLGILAALVLAKILFHGVRLTLLGILFSYLGVVLMETVLPDEMEYTWVKMDKGGR